MNILDVRVDNYSKQQTLQKVNEFLLSNKQHKIFTPNPEMLVDAQKDEYFKKVLNSGDLNVCDGFGLWLAAKLSLRGSAQGGDEAISGNNDVRLPRRRYAPPRNDIERYSGVDLMLDICKIAEQQNRSIYLLGSGSDAVVKKTAGELKKKFPNLKIIGQSRGPIITSHQSLIIYQNETENDEIIHNIIMSAPDILFVAFGHGKQEKWIYENLKDLPSVRIAMGVGGAFDYISGSVKRAPGLTRKFGLEWLYRLIKQPKRLPRIFKATFNFLYLLLIKKDN